MVAVFCRSTQPTLPPEDYSTIPAIAGIQALFCCALQFIIFALCTLIGEGAIYASDSLTVSGRVTLRGVYALEESAGEDPSLLSKMSLDWRQSGWRLYSWIEGGWDGTVRGPREDHTIFKNFSDVYQDNRIFFECKELFLERSFSVIDLRIGLQRFSWGRLNEYPVNDLLNPWDYTQFLLKPIEDRKIGVPSISAAVTGTDWSYQLVWVPIFVPYRLAKPNERWSLTPTGSILSGVSDAEVLAAEPDLPARTIGNGSVGLRIQKQGDIEWAFNLFHGYDPRPVFKTTALNIAHTWKGLLIDPGFIPSFHQITSLGIDGAAVRGDWSLRGEAAYAFGRAFDNSLEFWGYPSTLIAGITPLNPVEIERDTIDYGFAADYRLFEDALLTLQAQQTAILNRPSTLYDRQFETMLWANLNVGWMNQKIQTSLNLAFNPEHCASMLRASAYYIFTDSWKAGVIGVLLDGPPQSIFGRYSKNDQIVMELVYSW